MIWMRRNKKKFIVHFLTTNNFSLEPSSKINLELVLAAYVIFPIFSSDFLVFVISMNFLYFLLQCAHFMFKFNQNLEILGMYLIHL